MKKIFIIIASLIITFGQSVAQNEKNMSAYLMVYFLEHSHNVFFAVSNDGYTFTDVNGGQPILAGDTLALQRGVRDPHIYRGPDGAFYLAMTDLHIYAKQEGIRDTEWERDGSIYGWGNNRGIVLMKSRDLIHWSRKNISFDQCFEGYDDIGCVWAPATIYDEEAGKLMLTFTMRKKSGIHSIYYSYVNEDYDSLLTAPQLLFQYPRKCSVIDSDITHFDGKYHLFYKVDDFDGVRRRGIRHMASDHASYGYQYEDEWADRDSLDVEAPTCFKRIGENRYVLMYDVYSARPNNMGFCETTDFKHYEPIGRFNEGVMKGTNFSSPKHGAVIQITQKEMKRLLKYHKK